MMVLLMISYMMIMMPLLYLNNHKDHYDLELILNFSWASGERRFPFIKHCTTYSLETIGIFSCFAFFIIDWGQEASDIMTSTELLAFPVFNHNYGLSH